MKAIIAVLVMLLPGVAAAQINKCVDASGKTVGYAADCPPGTRTEQTKIKSAPAPASAPSEQKSLAEREADFRKRQVEKQEAEKKRVEAEKVAEQRKLACADSRAYLKNVQDQQRISKTDPKTGERTFLEDAQRPAEIKRAEANVAANCK